MDSMVVVRTQLEDNGIRPLYQFYSDAVGAGLMTYHQNLTIRANGYVIYGFDENNIRIWIDSQPKAVLFQGSDGSVFESAMLTGYIEILVWRTSSLQPTTTKYLKLASLAGEQFDQETSIGVPSDNNEIIVFLWAKATDGINEGFCFPGSGAMSYFTPADIHCSSLKCNYGGLTYAYTNSTLRIWKPENISSGNIIAIPNYFAGGHQTQQSDQALAVAQIWVVKETTLNDACEVDHDCIDSNSSCSNKICLCKEDFYVIDKQCEKVMGQQNSKLDGNEVTDEADTNGVVYSLIAVVVGCVIAILVLSYVIFKQTKKSGTTILPNTVTGMDVNSNTKYPQRKIPTEK